MRTHNTRKERKSARDRDILDIFSFTFLCAVMDYKVMTSKFRREKPTQLYNPINRILAYGQSVNHV